MQYIHAMKKAMINMIDFNRNIYKYAKVHQTMQHMYAACSA